MQTKIKESKHERRGLRPDREEERVTEDEEIESSTPGLGAGGGGERVRVRVRRGALRIPSLSFTFFPCFFLNYSPFRAAWGSCHRLSK